MDQALKKATTTADAVIESQRELWKKTYAEVQAFEGPFLLIESPFALQVDTATFLSRPPSFLLGDNDG